MTSKYVVETGDGYVGIYAVGSDGVDIGGPALRPIGLEVGDQTYVVDGEDRIEIHRDRSTVEGEPTVSYQVSKHSGHMTVCLRPHAITPLDVEPGDDVRVYDRDDRLVVVRADDDPFVDDGGEDSAT